MIFARVVIATLFWGVSNVHATPASALDRRGSDAECPYRAGKDHNINIQIRGWPAPTKLKIRFLDAGFHACAYTLVDPLVLPNGEMVDAIAKTSGVYADSSDEEGETEAEALEDLGELYGIGNSVKSGRQWILMKRHYGKTIVNTAAWRREFPKGYNLDESEAGMERCEAFMRHIYHLVAFEMAKHARSGWISHEFNWENFLFGEDEEGINHVEIIDWGSSSTERVDPSEADTVYERLIEYYEERSSLPIRDGNIHGIPVQGICQSDLRTKYGQPFESLVSYHLRR